MIVALAAGAAFLVCLAVLVAQQTGWRPPLYPFGPARSWGDAPGVHDAGRPTLLVDPAQAREDLILVCDALAILIRDEYPSQYSLAEIARTWGDGRISAAHIAALARYDATVTP